MEELQLQNKVITISGKEEKLQGGKPVIKIKDEKNLIYTVNKLKKDNTVSVAWTQLADIAVGQTLQISFVEQQGEYEGKAVTYRTVRHFNTDIGSGLTQKPRSEAVNAPQSQPQQRTQDDFGKRLALHGFVNALINAGTSPADITKEKLVELLELETRIEQVLSPVAQAVLKQAPAFFKAPEPKAEEPEQIEEIADIMDGVPF